MVRELATYLLVAALGVCVGRLLTEGPATPAGRPCECRCRCRADEAIGTANGQPIVGPGTAAPAPVGAGATDAIP